LTHLIRTTAEGAIGRLILNRPEKRNAISGAMWRAIPDAIAGLDADPAVRVILLEGAGGDFASGADIAEFDTVYATRAASAAYADDMARAMDALCACRTPRIAVIRGVCIGGGVAVALCCDLRFAEAGARFAVTPAKLGIAYCFEDTRRLVACVGEAAAKDILFSGRKLDAASAFQHRLVDAVFPAATLEDEAAAYANMVAANSPASIAVARDFIALVQSGQLSDTEATRKAYLDILEGPDFQEGKSAFYAKRPPQF
jgi:enoyl-CoA hydratase/carnithine racemase